MDINMEKGTVTLYEVKCSLCGQKIRSPEEGGCQELLVKHIDSECKVAKTLRDWESRGIYKEMMGLLRQDGLAKKLKKLQKHYSLEEIRASIDRLEMNEG